MAWKCVVTNAGAGLLANYAQGGHHLEIVGASVASGIMDEINMRVATALTDEQDAAAVVNAVDIGNATRFKIQVGPAPTAAYTAHQIGLWATLDDGERTLLALAQDSAGGVGVPLAATSPEFAFALFIVVAVSNDGDITVNIDESVYVTNGTLQDGLSLKVDKTSVANDLTTEDAGKVLDARQGKALADALALKADAADVYTKGRVDELLEGKADGTDVYTKEEADTLLADKANGADVYTKSQIDEALDLIDEALTGKADAGIVYTKSEIDAALNEKAECYVFYATIPTGGWDAYDGEINRVSVACVGMLATDSCGGAGIMQTGTEANDRAMRKAWDKITRIVTANDSITVYAKGTPATAIPIQIEVFR